MKGPVWRAKSVLFVMGVGKLRRLVGSTVIGVMQLDIKIMEKLVGTAADVVK